MAKLQWKPWHEVVKLRDDLLSGELTMQMFAADLYEVMMQRGKQPVYEKPENFFALTYPTYNLRQLVRDVVLRLAGKNDKAVRQLELTYGGGKTHTLITLRHLVFEPNKLPDLPSVAEFEEEIGQKPPKCRVVGLCFDKLDVEKGMEVRDPDGKVRTLKHPWSVLAYQIAGDEGLKLLHADGKAEERDTAPAENLLAELLEIPHKHKLGVLILIDEVLMYAHGKVGQHGDWRVKLLNFFQYLTQAATKVDRCCIVASLLASDPNKSDLFGRGLQAELYEIFQRQREVPVEPVGKSDVAEVLRRRFFKPESLKDQGAFRSHVVAALKGIQAADEQTARQGAEAEERFFKSFPFHPDLTEVFYSKWTNMDRFQRARGVLRTFALALREAVTWDTSPLVGPAVFLAAPDKPGFSEALREIVTVADIEGVEGKRQSWTGILDGEFMRAQEIQKESTALAHREIEQAVVATFLHSQPIGQNARTRDLMVLLTATRPDKIELEKGLTRWAQASYWLDDQYTAIEDGRLPGTWRLGSRPNLTQMHANAVKTISDEDARARLLDLIAKEKHLTANASAIGVKTHTLPTRPRDIEDDGAFHYAVLGPNAASESGKPSPEAKRFLDETTGSDKPRVYRNAVILLVPSKDGLELAHARVRDAQAWEVVREEIKQQQKDGNVDPARAQTLQINIEKAKGRVPEAIRQAYCIVVTVSDKDDVQAFKIAVGEEPHFNAIKNHDKSRIQDTPVTAEALLPDGPYNLWREGETARRVKDLSGAFAQLPHLPKMLKTSAILDTLMVGCERGTFVLRLMRPDNSFRTWWMSRPDEDVMSESALELVLPHAAELAELPPTLLAPGKLPELWHNGEIKAKDVSSYFDGSTVVKVQREGYEEPLQVPKAAEEVVLISIADAVEQGVLWLLSGPASILGEPVPAGVLNPDSTLSAPPSAISPAEILPANLPDAWKDDACSALSIATGLSIRAGKTLPWKTVKDVITSAVQARFLELVEGSPSWPCDLAAAQTVHFKVTKIAPSPGQPILTPVGVLRASADLEPAQIQELGDIMHKLLELKAKLSVPLKFHLEVTVGDGKEKPSEDVAKAFNALLKNVRDGFHLE